VVVVDDKQVRAVMTASWLRQMGWDEVFVLVASGSEKGFPDNPVLGEAPRDAVVDAVALNDLLKRGDATVIDLSLSRDYASAHIPGAWFAIRARLGAALEKIRPRGTVIFTSEDGVLAGLAAADARALTSLPARYLDGGNAAWCAAGFTLTKDDPRMADDPVDAWLKPYERPDGVKQAMADYLAWETDLVPRIARDGCAKFKVMR
jgi:rhodanese-related sulfurtransferase